MALEETAFRSDMITLVVHGRDIIISSGSLTSQFAITSNVTKSEKIELVLQTLSPHATSYQWVNIPIVYNSLERCMR